MPAAASNAKLAAAGLAAAAERGWAVRLWLATTGCARRVTVRRVAVRVAVQIVRMIVAAVRIVTLLSELTRFRRLRLLQRGLRFGARHRRTDGLEEVRGIAAEHQRARRSHGQRRP